eukprot:NODE_2499_length_1050_cov_128.516793_g2481_i0.p1 GENE.NODE_2499_length_1050_cov_128.516793_g2481_i0~~NODE_2499_length_1050_cov_128.516793_g2481_i0.p1  ORF type:complete len:271 (+),score=58.90 NODE_2499_length_1050_cov_128.516793_g2481_i0:87-815(+)
MASSAPALFVSISGLIGAGKTTLANALAEEMDLPVFHEPLLELGGYLADFYSDMSKYAFRLQVYLLNQRFRQHQEIIWRRQGAVQDRTIYEDSVFAKVLKRQGHMDERDYATYLDLFKNMSNFMKKPDLIVHLDVSPEVAHARIAKRGRECESGITLEYLQALDKAYSEFLDEISGVIPVIKVSYSAPYAQSPEAIAKHIMQEWNSMRMVRHVGYTRTSSPTLNPRGVEEHAGDSPVASSAS